MRQAAIGVIIIVTLGHLVGYLIPSLRHVTDLTWPAHARFHMFQSLWFLASWDILVVVVAAGPFRRGAVWAAWLLVVYVLSVPAAYFADLFVVPDGRAQGNMHTALYSTMLVLFVAGLLVGWPRKPQVK